MDKVMEIQGNPMPGGGYVTTFSDITHFKDIEKELQLINETLEQRVQQRTPELQRGHRMMSRKPARLPKPPTEVKPDSSLLPAMICCNP